MKFIKSLFWTCVFKWEYRRVDSKTCCCGSDMCFYSGGDYSHSYRSAKEWAITSAVNKKLMEK